jgi:1,2-diacylglycerol 3-alpha-glucosyltransferase
MLKRYGIPRVTTVPNCIDLSRFNPRADGGAVRESLGIKPSESTILYLGRLSREKKLEVLLHAVKLLASRDRSIRLVVGGTGPAEQHYRDLARSLGIMGNTRFMGFVSPKNLPGLYAASDAFCLPSTFETQGMVLLEAMAVGKPVVGADCLAIKELIRNGRNGEKFRPGDYTECAQKIERVLNNTAHYKHGAIRTAAEFSKEKLTGRLLDVYDSVLSEKAIY